MTLNIDHQTCFVFDLDDTPYKELDFLKSAYRHIAEKLENEIGENIYAEMINMRAEGLSVFDEIKNKYSFEASIKDIVFEYRFHFPKINLSLGAFDLLNELKQQNAVDLAGGAYDFMHYSAYCLLGVIWLSMADKAEQSDNESIKTGKANTCAFYIKRLLPRKDGFKANLFSGADDLMVVSDAEFDYQ